MHYISEISWKETCAGIGAIIVINYARHYYCDEISNKMSEKYESLLSIPFMLN